MTCKYGHDSERNKWGKCITCTQLIAQRWRETHPEKNKTAKAAWQKANIKRVLVKNREWAKANPERWAEAQRKWQKANPGKMQAIYVKRRAKKLNATPAWADQAKIDAVYREAEELRALGLDVHVDHFYPLQGETVSGLHVHNNLRVLLAEANRSKGNRLVQE